MSDSWNDRGHESRRSGGASSRTRPHPGSGLPAYRPVRSPLMSMGPSLDDERRRHRAARFVAVASVVAVVSVVVAIWGVSLLGREVVQGTGATSTVAVAGGGEGTNAPVLPSGRPAPQILAEAIVAEGQPGLRLQLPIRREGITGIGYSPRHERGVIELQPTGHRANLSWGRRMIERFLSTSPSGDLRWYRLKAGTPSMVIVGAPAGTDVYAPIDGTVIAISDYRVDGEVQGQIVQLQPLGDGQTVLVIRNIDAAEKLEVGQTMSEGATQLGTVHDTSESMNAPLARYTHDAGTGVELYALRMDGAPGAVF